MDGLAAQRLAWVLAQRGDLEELRARADAGDEYAAERVIWLLAHRGDPDKETGRRLLWMLARRSDQERSRAWADAGDANRAAAQRLDELLAQRGNLDEVVQVVRAQIVVGVAEVASWLPDLLMKQGRAEEAERLHRFGLNPDGSTACT
jgi:hypothetical protein